MKARVHSFDALTKAPFIGPKGGLYEDPQHKRPWNSKKRVVKPSNCPRCKGVAHIVSRQTSMGGGDVVSSAPCRTCNPRGRYPLDPKRVKAAGLPMPTPSARASKRAPLERDQPAQQRQMDIPFRRPAQVEMFKAGPYAVEAYPLGGYLEVQGLRIAIENDKGSRRRWYNPATQTHGETVMVHDYGFIIGHEGADGDEVDVYVGPDLDSDTVVVVNQRQMGDKRKFDEHKVMIGFGSEAEARAAYLKHYDKHGPQMLGSCAVWSMARFKRWLSSRGAKKKPVRKSFANAAVQHVVRVPARGYVGGPGGAPDGRSFERARVLAIFRDAGNARDFVNTLGRSDVVYVPESDIDYRDRVVCESDDVETWYVLDPLVTRLMVML